ncbi:response regulator transcription factor [Methylobacter sp. S3L5C]|uniref:response regulator transcription factor n=1 Tax=Methylobacter sp. S3L5C TaxID=2839024 RepID=UPI001FAC330E|nr:response regulator [Methylobacter sp. S3L5C]UOA09385.1 response regulator [Methylobacter sp. S3L5C]
MNDSTPTVFIIDDDPSVLKALARLLRSVGLNATTFLTPQEFFDQYDQGIPGCLVLDIAMPGINGLKMQQVLADQDYTLPIIFLTGHGDIRMSVQAIKQGAIDFLTKPANDTILIAAIHSALDKDRIAREKFSELSELKQRLAKLTPREREVLSHIISGKINKKIAAELGTVEKTIKVHRAHLMMKLKVHSLAELVKLAERLGVTSSPIE